VIRFQCSHCDKTLKAPEKKVGTTVVCPRCEGRCVIPTAALGSDPDGASSQPEGYVRTMHPQPMEEEPSLFSTMTRTWRWTVFGVAGVGLLSLLLPLVAPLVPPLDPIAPAARYAALIVVPLSGMALLTILYGHGSRCLACGEWWARRRIDEEFVDKEVFEKDGEPFARAIYRTNYACDSCGHRWSATNVEELKESHRDHSRARLG
jgi:DNA-directed RNA polymerase subunit RPC12/RpoP